MSNPVKPVRRENVPSTIAARLRRQIAQGELSPGDQLPGNRELAVMYSVSVGSVREAISMLISQGIVETRAGRGTYVVSGDDTTGAAATVGVPLRRREAEELIEAREVIEVQVAALAAERATPRQIEKLRRCVEQMDAASGNAEDYPDADVEFHLALAEAAGNRYLFKAMTDIRALLKTDMELGAEAAIRRFGDLRLSVDGHRGLVDAIETQDSGAARERVSAIVLRNREFVLGLYALAPGEASAAAP